MAGVVYAGGTPQGSLGKFGVAIALANNAQIPPGNYWSPVAWNASVNGALVGMPAGFVESDGACTMGAAGNIYPLGAGTPPIWPWPVPFPLTIATP